MGDYPDASSANPTDVGGVDMEIVAALRRIIRAVDLHSRRLVEECGLTGPQLLVLQAAERLGRVALGALAATVHLSQATVSGILDRLESRGLLERGRDERDRRSAYVLVTDLGRRVLSRAPSLIDLRFKQELAKLRRWERTMLLASMQRIAEMMDAEQLDASPVLTVGPVHAAGSVRSEEPDAPNSRPRPSRDADPYKEMTHENHPPSAITPEQGRRKAHSGRASGRRR